MSDYSVRVANPFDSLLSQPGTSVGKRRSKKKKKSDTLSSSEPSTQQAPVETGFDQDGFVEPKKNLKAKKRKEKKENEKLAASLAAAPAATEAAPLPSVPAGDTSLAAEHKHVRFGDADCAGERVHSRKSSLKQSVHDNEGDVGVVKQLRDLGYETSDILLAIAELEEEKGGVLGDAHNVETVMKRLHSIAKMKALQGTGLVDFTTPGTAASVSVSAGDEASGSISAPSKKNNGKRKDKAPKDGSVASPRRVVTSSSPKLQPEAASAMPPSVASLSTASASPPAEHSSPIEKEPSLMERIEAHALECDLALDEAAVQIEKWVIMLESGERSKKSGNRAAVDTEGQAVFWTAFFQSQALEEIARRLVETPKLSPKVESSVTKLFGASIVGSSGFVRWLFHSLRALHQPLQSASNKKDLLEKIVAIVTNQKQLKHAHIQLSELTQTSLAAAAVAASSSSLGSKKPQSNGVPPASRDPLSALQDSAEDSVLAVTVKLDALKNLRGALGNVLSSDELTLSLRSLERDIAAHVDRSRSAIAELHRQRDGIATKKESLTADQKRELDRMKLQDRDFALEKLKLSERKRDLVAELDRIDRQLIALDTNQQKNALTLQELEANFSSTSSNLASMDEELGFRICSVTKDETAAQAVTHFIEDARVKVLDSSNKDHVQLTQAFRSAAKSYLHQLRELVDSHHSLLGFLNERVQFCTVKLNQLKAEHNKMLALGLHDAVKLSADVQMEDQMATMIDQDSAAVQRYQSKVNHTLAVASKQAQEFGMHTDAVNTGYVDFVTGLREKRAHHVGTFVFDISVFPEPVLSQPAPLPASPSSGAAPLSSISLSLGTGLSTTGTPAVHGPSSSSSKVVGGSRAGIGPGPVGASSPFAHYLTPSVSLSGSAISTSSSSVVSVSSLCVPSSDVPLPQHSSSPSSVSPPPAAPVDFDGVIPASSEAKPGARKPPMRGGRGGVRTAHSAAVFKSASVQISPTVTDPPMRVTPRPAAPVSENAGASGPRSGPLGPRRTWGSTQPTAQTTSSSTSADFPSLNSPPDHADAHGDRSSNGTSAPSESVSANAPSTGPRTVRRDRGKPPGFETAVKISPSPRV